LSGLELTGSIPDDIAFGAVLSDLALSHKALVGTIPHASIQVIPWKHLDLSFNKFSGELMNFNVTRMRTLLLQVNRFAGFVPLSVTGNKDIKKLEILEGNLFEETFAHPFPSQDPKVSTTESGSYTYEVASLVLY
jgi:hypothetical protein